MSLLKEFKDFINKGNVVDLSIAVVVGGAFGKIVTALVGDLVMPVVNAVLPQGDWRKWEVTPLHFRIGDFFGTVVDFLIVGFVVFLVLVKLLGAARRNKAEAAPATKQCSECLETVPAAARRCRACTSVLTGIALLLLGRIAAAQSTPQFVFAKPDEAKPGVPPPPAVEWKAQAKGGFTATSGNSQSLNATAAGNVSRRTGGNKLTFDGAVAYGRSSQPFVVLSADPATPTTIVGLDHQSTTTTDNWFTKGRYDRFLTANNSLFGAGEAAADKVAGKTFFGGGQIGYSRQLVKSDLQTLVAELGYDFSHESYTQPLGMSRPGVSIHSARAFVGETLKFTPQSGASASVEAFFNLNQEGSALVAGALPTRSGVSAFHDTRVNGKLGLTSTLYKRLSLAFGFTIRYDQNPAPLPVPSGAPAGSMFSPTTQLFADKVDTITEANLVYTFL